MDAPGAILAEEEQLLANTELHIENLTFTRVVESASGTRWHVREVPASRYRSRRCLAFDSGMVIRCVSEYPADWRDLDDAQLLALTRKR